MTKKDYHSRHAENKKNARAIAANRRISTKYAVEICREIKGKPVKKAEAFLERVREHTDYLPLRKYSKKVAHRKGKGAHVVKAGRFPENACKEFLDLLKSVKANADAKGLDTEKLMVMDALATQGFRRTAMQPKGHISGRMRERKSTHLEIVVAEAK